MFYIVYILCYIRKYLVKTPCAFKQRSLLLCDMSCDALPVWWYKPGIL